ncbi:2-oxo acid dehydrogenase subunit E2 [Aquisphaera giovannonii]|nr:2-oxo acid dehydrogenase subunit E2 [Aquisphaera giovannonii]
MRMPDLATTGSPMRVVRLLAAAGDEVARGQPILEVETDKATMEVESTVAGRLVAIAVEVDDEVLAGQLIATFAVESAGAAWVAPAAKLAPSHPAPAEDRTARASAAASPASDRPSFFARNRARRSVQPTSSKRASLALSLAGRVVARRMQEIKRTVPHFYVQASANAGGMVRRRDAAEGPRPAWDAFFVVAAARALREHPRFAHRYDQEKLVPHGGGAIGVAVDLDDDLYTITVDDPAAKEVERVSAEIREQVDQLRSGDPKARQPRPASMTVSNLGGSGVESFAAIVNAPEASILAVGSVLPAAVVESGGIFVQDRVRLTLSVDHRVAGGKAAAAFLHAIVRGLESF